MAYQSLYRRYRSGRFDELVGQQHVVTALKNAVTEDRVGHAYLFSGPRGTGKTSTARILGKALNCTNLGDDGEPCCECESCLAFQSGTSYDLQELDAASNNGVEAIRDLISKVALGSPGRTKVYILDEVHMLTAGAENALLKTLEEPPDHVVFVLATTEPHKVVPTIRSRTQHYEFELIPAQELDAHVRWVAQDAGLSVDDEMVDYVIRVGGGSARDTLSALDQVVAAGGIPRGNDVIDDIMAGLSGADAGQVVVAVNEALKAGRDPRVIGEELLARLRDAFLSAMGASLDHLSDAQAEAARTAAGAMGPAAITRSLERIGGALIDMRQAPDPRVDLEVALLRLSRPDLDTDLAAVVARLERLEQGGVVAAPGPAVVPAPEMPSPAPAAPPEAAAPVQPAPAPAEAPAPRPAGGRPADGARAALAATRGEAPPTPSAPPPADEPSTPSPRPTLGATRSAPRPDAEPAAAAPPAEAAPPVEDPTPPPQPDSAPEPVAEAPAQPAPASEPAPEPVAAEPAPAAPAPAGALSLAALEASWDEIKAGLPGRAKSRFSGGRFISVEGASIVFGLPNAIHRDRCLECVDDVRGAISSHVGNQVDLQLVVDGDAPPPVARAIDQPAPKVEAPVEEDEVIDLDSLTDASADAAGGIDLLTEAFPGAELIEPDPEPGA